MKDTTKEIVHLSRALLESIPDAIVVADPHGRIALINARTEQLFEYERRELMGQPIELLVPTRFRVRHRQHRKQYRQSPGIREIGKGVELLARRKNGSEFPVEIGLSPVMTSRGLYVMSVIRDITERKRIAEELRQSEERFALAVKATDAGIWDWNLQSSRVYFSPHWKNMLGYADTEIGEEISEWESRLHKDERDFVIAALRDYLQGRSGRYECEHRLRCKDGSYRWFLARGVLVRDDNGRPFRMIGSNVDITDRKASQQMIARQQSQLAAAGHVQKYLQPTGPVSVSGFAIAGCCYPAEFAAGDHYEYVDLRDGSLLIVLADVSGHGVGPAILTAAFHAQVQELAANHTETATIVSKLNASLHEKTASEMFATLLAVRLLPDAPTLEYINAGHPAGLIFDRKGNLRDQLTSCNLPLGIKSDVEYQTGHNVPLHDGDLLLLFTDGLVEAQSKERAPFGVERVIQCVRQHLHRQPSAIVTALRSSLRDYLEDGDLQDDVTIVAVKSDGTCECKSQQETPSR